MNSSPVNALALSDTITSSKPSDANNLRRCSIVAVDVDVFVMGISNVL